MNEIKESTLTFEDIKHYNENGAEFWYMEEFY